MNNIELSPSEETAPAQSLSALLATCTRHEDGSLTAEPSDSWKQGRSLYGGIQAALAVEAMQVFAEGLPIRTLQATLCAPVPSGPLRISTEVLRIGGSTRQIEARFLDGENVLAVFVAIFGRARESVVSHDFAPAVYDDDNGVELPFLKGLTPDFLQQFQATLLKGHFPGAGERDTEQVYRVSLRDEAEKTGLAQLLTMSDFPPPIGLSWLSQPSPASTMTWMLNFTGQRFDDQGLDDWLIDVQLDSAHDGYTQQSVTLFAPDGRAIARGTQCMVVFG
ncbi:MAG: thioesterase family protein [Pseudomonadota bacterium]